MVTDPDRLDQVLSNLMENALRFARSRIAVGARRPRTAGSCCGWTTTGRASPRGTWSRVFTPHFTSDRTGVRRAGTGLGLAIVAELATAMGGGARAESPLEAGDGTRMVVWLPAAGPTERAAPDSARR